MKRPYTAEQIVAKRGNLEIQYPSNHQAKKLWKVLEEKYSVGTWCHWILVFTAGDTDVGQRQGRQASHMVVWTRLCLLKWPNISRLSMFLGGNVRRRLAQPTNLHRI